MQKREECVRNENVSEKSKIVKRGKGFKRWKKHFKEVIGNDGERDTAISAV